MFAARLGDAAQGAAGAAGTVGKRDVAERQHPHQPLVVVQHRQPAHLNVGHVLHDLIESSSSKQYFTSELMISRTAVLADFPAATARTAMSRSVIMPTSRSFCPTGRQPQSISFIRRAASRIG